MARPGMTPGTPPDAAPETGRLDLDPGRNVGTAEFAHASPPPDARPSQTELDEAQAEARRAASPPSYQAHETVENRRPGPGLLVIGGAIVVIVLAALFFLF